MACAARYKCRLAAPADLPATPGHMAHARGNPSRRSRLRWPLSAYGIGHNRKDESGHGKRYKDEHRYHTSGNGIRYWRGDDGRYYCRRSTVSAVPPVRSQVARSTPAASGRLAPCSALRQAPCSGARSRAVKPAAAKAAGVSDQMPCRERGALQADRALDLGSMAVQGLGPRRDVMLVRCLATVAALTLPRLRLPPILTTTGRSSGRNERSATGNCTRRRADVTSTRRPKSATESWPSWTASSAGRRPRNGTKQRRSGANEIANMTDLTIAGMIEPDRP